jgi:shikimate dehydrogenase
MANKIVGVIGWPITHSLSPVMHNRAFLDLGLSDWAYVPMPVEKARIKEAVVGLRALGFLGANVTVPHKEAVVPYLDKLSDEALAIKAVNTIIVDKDGSLIGHNTDGRGFIADLSEHKIDVKNLSVLILGAGGSARALVHALLSHGCCDIAIVNRTKNKADEIAALFSSAGTTIVTGSLDSETLSLMATRDLVINTTSLGMAKTLHQMAWDAQIKFSRDQIVYDLIYNPAETALLSHAKHCGARGLNGLGMLVHQGALAFELWTGLKAPIAVMRKAALEACPLSP